MLMPHPCAGSKHIAINGYIFNSMQSREAIELNILKLLLRKKNSIKQWTGINLIEQL